MRVSAACTGGSRARRHEQEQREPPASLRLGFPGNGQGAALGSAPWVLRVTVTSPREKQAIAVIRKYRPGAAGALKRGQNKRKREGGEKKPGLPGRAGSTACVICRGRLTPLPLCLPPSPPSHTHFPDKESEAQTSKQRAPGRHATSPPSDLGPVAEFRRASAASSARWGTRG